MPRARLWHAVRPCASVFIVQVASASAYRIIRRLYDPCETAMDRKLAVAKDSREKENIIKKIHVFSPWWREPGAPVEAKPEVKERKPEKHEKADKPERHEKKEKKPAAKPSS